MEGSAKSDPSSFSTIRHRLLQGSPEGPPPSLSVCVCLCAHMYLPSPSPRLFSPHTRHLLPAWVRFMTRVCTLHDVSSLLRLGITVSLSFSPLYSVSGWRERKKDRPYISDISTRKKKTIPHCPHLYPSFSLILPCTSPSLCKLQPSSKENLYSTRGREEKGSSRHTHTIHTCTYIYTRTFIHIHRRTCPPPIKSVLSFQEYLIFPPSSNRPFLPPLSL